MVFPDEPSSELTHCILLVEQNQFILAHAEFEFCLNLMQSLTIDVMVSSSIKRMFGAYLAACCFVMRQPLHLRHILDARWKSEIMGHAIGFFESAGALETAGPDAATRVICFVRSLESGLIPKSGKPRPTAQPSPLPQPSQIWDLLVKDLHVKKLEQELIRRGLKVVKTNDYVRISNSKVKLFSVGEFTKLAEQEVQRIDLLDVEVRANHQVGLVSANRDVPSPSLQSRESSPKLDAVLEELDGMIGLATIKKDVRSLVNLARVRKMREAQGLPLPDVSLHLVFAGNPGTGKTTVARLIAKLYACLGILRQGHLVEVDRSGIVAGYVGQTAIKTAEIITRSLDGVLFIDEAYSLSEGGGQDFGRECIETLLKGMEDNRGRLIVIVAGYTEKMATFIESNPGLRSRFSRVIEFPDYSCDELLLIADRMVRQHNFVFDDRARSAFSRVVQERTMHREMSFGNARGVRNMFEAIVSAQANRIVTIDNPSRIDLQTVTVDDIISASSI